MSQKVPRIDSDGHFQKDMSHIARRIWQQKGNHVDMTITWYSISVNSPVFFNNYIMIKNTSIEYVNTISGSVSQAVISFLPMYISSYSHIMTTLVLLSNLDTNVQFTNTID
jgi:hypothetical protein